MDINAIMAKLRELKALVATQAPTFQYFGASIAPDATIGFNVTKQDGSTVGYNERDAS